jgi:hypothetical protein
MRIGGIELHEILVKNGRDVGHTQGRAGMAAFGLLHGIHRKKPDAVGHIPQVLIAGFGDGLDDRSGRGISHDWRLLLDEIDLGRGYSSGFVSAKTEFEAL